MCRIAVHCLDQVCHSLHNFVSGYEYGRAHAVLHGNEQRYVGDHPVKACRGIVCKEGNDDMEGTSIFKGEHLLESGFNGSVAWSFSPLFLCEVSLFGIGNKVFGKEYLKGGVEIGLDQSIDPELVDLACASFLLSMMLMHFARRSCLNPCINGRHITITVRLDR